MPDLHLGPGVVRARVALAGLLGVFAAVLLVCVPATPAGTDAAPGADGAAGTVLIGSLGPVAPQAEGAAVDPSGGATPVSGPARVAVFGDSLGVEVGSVLPGELGGGATVELQAYPGVALCDYLPTITEVATTTRPSAIVVMFVGNTFTPCSQPGGGPPDDDDRDVALRGQLDGLAATLQPLGIPLFIVGEGPLPYPFALPRDLNASFADLAAREQQVGRDVTFVDAGSSLAGPDGGWTGQLPCRPDETIWMGCADGRIVVRGPDGRHLCPVDLHSAEACPYWSSGAHRMAHAVAASLRDRLGLAT